MKNTRMLRAIVSLTMMAVLVMAMLPMAAAIAEGDEGATILFFVVPETRLDVAAGTEKQDIPLPEVLEATLEGGMTASIPITWDDAGPYVNDTVGVYTFTAVIDASYVFAGEVPIAVVTVTQVTETNAEISGGKIAGSVWLDENENGIWDAQESAIPGFAVSLYANENFSVTLASTTTDADGAYAFCGLAAGDYKVGVAAQTIEEAEYLIPIKTLQKGEDNKFNADRTLDPISSVTNSITIGEGETVTGINAGMRGVQQVAPMATDYVIDLSNPPPTNTYHTYNNTTKTITILPIAGIPENDIVIQFTQSNQLVPAVVKSIVFPNGTNLTAVLRGVNMTGPEAPSTLAPITLQGNAQIQLNCYRDTTNSFTAPVGSNNCGIEVPANAKFSIGGGGNIVTTVNATGDGYGAGIGGRDAPSGIIRTIGNNTTVNATGGYWAAGIGGGRGSAGGDISFSGSTINAYAGQYGAAIGGGSQGAGGAITIEGAAAIINAYAGEYGAAIGGGNQGAGGAITISNGSVNAYAGARGAAIGGGAGTSSGATSLSINREASIKAYAMLKPAIESMADNSGTGFYVNNYLITGGFPSERKIEIYTAGSTTPVRNTLSLPAGYVYYGYSTNGTVSQNFNEYLCNAAGTAHEDQIARVKDNDAVIYSIKTLDGYNLHNNNANNGVLPVKLGLQEETQQRYLVYKDANMTALLSTHHWLADAVAACGTDGAYTIVATQSDLDMANAHNDWPEAPALTNPNMAVTIPANKHITLTSDTGNQWTVAMGSDDRHFNVQGSLTLANIILRGRGDALGDFTSGGVNVATYGALVMNGGAEIYNCYSGSQTGGGGVALAVDATFTMNANSKIYANIARIGGGVANWGGIFTMVGGEISGNFATTNNSGFGGFGGGVFLGCDSPNWIGDLDAQGGKISGNTADKDGGGIYSHISPLIGGKYSNINIAASVVFTGNNAQYWDKYLGAAMSNILSQNTSVAATADSNVPPLNNLDINLFYSFITYDANNSTTPGTHQVRHITDSLATVKTFVDTGLSAEGETFLYWCTDPLGEDEAGAVRYNEGATFNITQDITLYAIYAQTTTLTISKTISGDHPNRTKGFEFTLYLQDASGTTFAADTQFNYVGAIIAGSGATAPTAGTLTLDADGKATFVLKHGQSITISGVAIDAKVRIEEAADDNYDTSFVDSDGDDSASGQDEKDTRVREMSQDRRFDFTNARAQVTPTGIDPGSGQGLLFILLPLLGLGIYLAAQAVGRKYQRAK